MNEQDNGLALDPTTGSIVASTPEAITFIRATVIAHGAALYLNTGIKPNRAYTPTAMRDALNQITGQAHKRLQPALAAYVDFAAKAGHPVTSETVLRAASASRLDKTPKG